MLNKLGPNRILMCFFPLTSFGTCVKAVPDSAWYFYNEGVCLMRWPDGDKKQAYQSLIKARTLFIYVMKYVIHLTEFILQNS